MTASNNPDEPTRESLSEPPAQAALRRIGNVPSPEAQTAAQPAKEAVEEAVHQIKTPEQANQVAADVVSAASGTTERQVREQTGAAPEPAQAIQATAATTSGTEQAAATLVAAAQQVASSEGETREALEAAVQEATNPEQHGVTTPEATEPVNLLRDAILKRMAPHQALDTRLFLAINHLPHNELTNRFMSFMTIIMNGGSAWLLTLVVIAIVDRKRGRQVLLQVIPPFWSATMTVEYPIKYFFRRRRPFVDVVRAIAVGKKPGTYSFPSGHSSAAFAGAWLLRRHYPALTPLWYTIATLVAFSRIFLGAHYPGDVVSGALAGTGLAELTRWVIDQGDDALAP
jgi:undecaprenyl-diphosphatase